MIFTVHFEKDAAGHPIRHIELEDKEVTEEEPQKTAEESMHEIVDAQKRMLDQWCFAEHYEPHVLLQVNSCFINKIHLMVFTAAQAAWLTRYISDMTYKN